MIKGFKQFIEKANNLENFGFCLIEFKAEITPGSGLYNDLSIFRINFKKNEEND